MEQHDLNKRFFTEEEVPVPVPATDAAWEQMQTRLDKEMPQKEKRKKRFFLFFFLLVLFIGVSMVFITGNNKEGFDNKNTYPAKNEPVSIGDNDKRIDSNNSQAANNDVVKKGLEKPGESPTNNTAIDADNSTSTGKQTASIDQKNNSKSANIKSGKKDINNNGQQKKSITTYHKQKIALPGNAQRRIETQQNILSNEATDNVFHQPTVIASGKNANIHITAAPATADRDSMAALADKENAAASSNKIIDSLDITISKEPEDEKPVQEKMIWKGGLQWNVQVPTGSTGNYFTGGNLKSQPYVFLIPGIWASAQINRSVFGLELNPYFSSLVPSKTYTEFTNSSSSLDTVKIVTESRQLNKLIGTSFTASFGYNIKDNWWLKGGLQMQWWRKGIATANILEEKYPSGNTAEKTFSSSSHMFAVENSEWNYFTKFQVNPLLEGMYTFKRWETAFRVSLPIAPITSSGIGPKNSVRTELILRYQLFKK